MTAEHGPLLDEHILRRALRLDAEEVPPRLDPLLLAAAAGEPHGRSRDLAVAVVVAFVGGWIWSEVFRALIAGVFAVRGIDPLGAAIDLITAVAVRAAPLTDAATHPAVPIAILAAAVLAVLFEQRGRAHAAAS
jgi:hypothetical protein